MKGAPHVTVYSDHSTLTSLCKKELIKTENILERISDFNYEIRHQAGAKNSAADYLSRHTTSKGQALEFHKGKVAVKVRTVWSPLEDILLWKVTEATSSCPNTLKIMEAIKAG